MRGITGTKIDEKNKSLEIMCDNSIKIRDIAKEFVSLLNNPESGGSYSDRYRTKYENENLIEIEYGDRKQAFIMRDGESIFIIDDCIGVGIINICNEYKRLCAFLNIEPKY